VKIGAVPSETAPKPLWKRWWVWLLAAPLLCCLSGGGIAAYTRATLDRNPVYVGALRRAEKNGGVRQQLGIPLTVTSVTSAQVSFMGQPTKLKLEVSGPKGDGTLTAVASGNEPDSLEIFKMSLRVAASGEEIRLDGTGGSPRR
jgi:hypothetical protein